MMKMSYLTIIFVIVHVVYLILAIGQGQLEQMMRIAGLLLVSFGVHVFYWKHQKYNWMELLLQSVLLGWLFGSYYNFYETISWYDEVVHGLAPGVWCLMALLYARKYLSFKMPEWFYCVSIVAILMIPWVLWEAYEYYVGYSILHSFPMTLGDTISDLLLDLGGSGLFAVGFYLRKWWIKE